MKWFAMLLYIAIAILKLSIPSAHTSTATLQGPHFHVAWNRDDTRLAVLDAGGHLTVHDVATGQVTKTYTANPSVEVDWNPLSGDVLAYGDSDEATRVRVVNVVRDTTQVLEHERLSVYSLAFSDATGQLAVGYGQGNIGPFDTGGLRVYSANATRLLYSVGDGLNEVGNADFLAWSADGQHLASLYSTSNFSVLQIHSADLSNVTQPPDLENIYTRPQWYPQTERFLTLVDGRRIFNLYQQPPQIYSLGVNFRAVKGIAWHPEGRYLTIFFTDPVQGDYDLAHLDTQSELIIGATPLDGSVEAIEWSHDGTRLAVALNNASDGLSFKIVPAPVALMSTATPPAALPF